VHVQALCLEKLPVRRHEVSGKQADHVSRDDLAARHGNPDPVAPDRRRQRNPLPQAFGRASRPVSLNEVQRHGEHDHRDDDPGLEKFAEGGCDRARRQQDENERISDRRPKAPQQARPRRDAELVGPVLEKASRRLRGGQPPRRLGRGCRLVWRRAGRTDQRLVAARETKGLRRGPRLGRIGRSRLDTGCS